MGAAHDWVIDKTARDYGRKLALELLLSLKETVHKDSQNEALGAAIALLLGRHYSSIHEIKSPELADRWMATVLEAARNAVALNGVEVAFGFVRKE
jgi:hypothetical protein